MFQQTDDRDYLPTLDIGDISPEMRLALLALLVLVVLALTGCGTPQPITRVERHPPAADMVRLQPLPAQTDASLGGIFQGYVNAAQQYRACVDRHAELQNWVNSLYEKK